MRWFPRASHNINSERKRFVFCGLRIFIRKIVNHPLDAHCIPGGENPGTD
jgi:hypothetical protein